MNLVLRLIALRDWARYAAGMQQINRWRSNLTDWNSVLAPRCTKHYRFQIEPPASENDVHALEVQLNRTCPQPLRKFLLEETGKVNFWWHLDPPRWWSLRKKHEILGVLDEPDFGCMEYGLGCLKNMANSLIDGYDDLPSAIAEKWSMAWPFLVISSGDSIALDCATSTEAPPVIYFDHEQPERIWTIARSFEEFMLGWTWLGCVGPECLDNFAQPSERTSSLDEDPPIPGMLDFHGERAKTFRHYFGLPIG